jgi:hypothetical protein
MQQPWWLPVRDLTRHVLVYSALLTVFFASTLFGSELSSMAGHMLLSKFSLHVWRLLEYAVVVFDALAIFIFMAGDLFRSIKRQFK